MSEAMALLVAEHRAMKEAIHTLFAVGGAAAMDNPAPRALPDECRRDNAWQSPGTVSVRVKALQRVAKAAGIAE